MCVIHLFISLIENKVSFSRDIERQKEMLRYNLLLKVH